jgi:hypothetical protein
VTVELVFKEGASLRERPGTLIAAPELEDVEADVVVVTEQMETAHQVFIEDGHLAIAPGRRRGVSRSRRRAPIR